MKIAIGIVTYNNEKYELEMWLRSLYKAIDETNDDVSFCLYWIDNGETTNTFNECKFAHNIPSQGNVGYTVAINTLIKEAISDNSITHFQSSNPDGVFHPDFFKNIVDFSLKYPLSIIESSQFPEEHPKKYDPITYDTNWASGAATLYPIEIIKKVGLMDETFFMYCEDVDFSWRTRLEGFGVKHCPNALYGHHVINRIASKTITKYFYESGRYLAIKWGAEEFTTWCEKTLLDEQIYNNKNELPIITIDNDRYSNDEIIKVVDFSKYFYFSEGRW